MATLSLTTQGIDVGYGEDGFWACGTSVLHRFENNDWQFGTPKLEKMPVFWRIGMSGANPFEDYVAHTYPQADLSPRVPMLREYFQEVGRKAVGSLHRWSHEEPTALSYYFPNDPALAALIVGAVAAERELTIWGRGWLFLNEERPAPASSVDGFMERKEPAFTLDLPILRLK